MASSRTGKRHSGHSVPSIATDNKMSGDKRIDAPHAPPCAEPDDAARADAGSPGEPENAPERPVPTLVVVNDAGATAEQVRLQAGQLAEHLRLRQKDLDQREAKLNAWAAELERDARTARMWLAERTAELEQHETVPAESDTLQADLLRQAAEQLNVRQQQLEQAEAHFADERNALEQLHAELRERQRAIEEDAAAEQERLAVQRRLSLAEIEEKRRTVQERSAQVDQSRAALEQLRGELGRMHRETLEIRLATEELWVQLSGEAPPAAMVRSLGRIRTKLADHYRMANAELHQQKLELERLRGQLGEQYDKLVRQKQQFDHWAVSSQEEADKQAARLMARQQEIARQEAELRDQRHLGQAERLAMQQEIRRLQLQLAAQARAAMPI